MSKIDINNSEIHSEVLPLNCEVYYWKNFLDNKAAKILLDELRLNFPLSNKEILMSDGSKHISETGSYLFADNNLTSFDSIPEVWGGRSPWTETLLKIRENIELLTGVHFHIARCVHYQNGMESMGFHRDLPAYGTTSHIASLSLGAEREFMFRSITNPNEVYSIKLLSGSLLLMGDGCQDQYEHSLPISPDCNTVRLNLTFRKYGWD